MNAAPQLGAPSFEARLSALEAEVKSLAHTALQQSTRLDSAAELMKGSGQEEKLSLIVFSGSLDRLIAAFVLATGAAAMGMKVSMFFTFWGTAALRLDNVRVKKTFLERLFGWMLPKGVSKLPLSQMNMAGGGPAMIRYIMKKNGVASVEEMIEVCKELGVELNVCTMSMDLLGMKPDELIDYPGRTFCGVAKFIETAAPGKITMLL
ncbi:MAG TPA: DsrE/DsrF/DrsH-like family protein [Polyangiaceae bacterium]|nr:DsrE/DsrF/DrsH-like family protein [Polyangiaceae bacterium]